MYLSISNSSFASHVFQRALCSASEPCHQIMIWMWVIVGWDSKIEGVAAYSWVQIGVGGRTETAERNAVSWPCEMESICINLQNQSTLMPRLIEPPHCYSMRKDSPQPQPKNRKENHHFPSRPSAKTICNYLFSWPTGYQAWQRSSQSVEPFFDAASPAQEHVKLFVTFLRHCITLGGLISLAMCVLALKMFLRHRWWE